MTVAKNEAARLLKAFPCGEGGPAGPDEGQVCRSDPFTGNRGKVSPHQSAGGAADSFPRGGSHAAKKRRPLPRTALLLTASKYPLPEPPAPGVSVCGGSAGQRDARWARSAPCRRAAARRAAFLFSSLIVVSSCSCRESTSPSALVRCRRGLSQMLLSAVRRIRKPPYL